MPQPLIGITIYRSTPGDRTPYFAVSESYVHSIQRAGGIPVLLPNGLSQSHLESLRSSLDGIMFTGGGDLDPQLYNGNPNERVYGIEPDRDQQEIALVRLASSSGWPFLGICRGIQVINVALGGTLFTDIADQLPGALRHDWYPDIRRDYLAHTVAVKEGSRLAVILGGTTVPVNSLHHQGVQQIASGLNPMAFAPDGLLEAVELAEHPFGLGVQWHPECLPELPAMQALFKAFVDAAGGS